MTGVVISYSYKLSENIPIYTGFENPMGTTEDAKDHKKIPLCYSCLLCVLCVMDLYSPEGHVNNFITTKVNSVHTLPLPLQQRTSS